MNAARSVLEWDDYCMSLAFLAGQLSKDPLTKVGACIANDNKVIVGIGYNQMPKTTKGELPWDKNNEDNLENKYWYVCCAAMMAITNKNLMDIKGCALYTCIFPCNKCAKYIIQNGIKKVIYYSNKYIQEDYSKAAIRMFDLADVKYIKFGEISGRTSIGMDFSEIEQTSMDEEYNQI